MLTHTRILEASGQIFKSAKRLHRIMTSVIEQVENNDNNAGTGTNHDNTPTEWQPHDDVMEAQVEPLITGLTPAAGGNEDGFA